MTSNNLFTMLRITGQKLLVNNRNRFFFSNSQQLYKITAVMASSTPQPLLQDLFKKNGNMDARCISTNLYSSAHTCSPVLECEYHVNGNYDSINPILETMVNNAEIRKSIGFMDYDIDIVMTEN